ncbi:hypothetical protein O0S10_00380 [Methanocorpusculum sp. MG]|uniref:Uncharacterized protein n=2 Tax=Methanocorpusculum petauri TaxID=3002863 RepID=A0ABT4ID49_9EURY|nr:hypothetical protein [Methanocorpusculum petauri]
MTKNIFDIGEDLIRQYPDIRISINDIIFEMRGLQVIPIPGYTWVIEGYPKIVSPIREHEKSMNNSEVQWEIHHEDPDNIQTVEELYRSVDWKHPVVFNLCGWEDIRRGGNPPKQLKICDEVWEVGQPHLTIHPVGGWYTYKAVLSNLTPDKQLQSGEVCWSVDLITEPLPDVRDPPKKNDEYYPYTYWELPLDIYLKYKK